MNYEVIPKHFLVIILFSQVVALIHLLDLKQTWKDISLFHIVLHFLISLFVWPLLIIDYATYNWRQFNVEKGFFLILLWVMLLFFWDGSESTLGYIFVSLGWTIASLILSIFLVPLEKHTLT